MSKISKELEKQLTVSYLVGLQPKIIGDKIITDKNFTESLGVDFSSALIINEHTSILASELLNGIRECLKTGVQKDVKDINENTHTIKNEDEKIVIYIENEDKTVSEYNLNQFFVLSDDSSVRIPALEAWSHRIQPDCELINLLSEAKYRALTIDEILTITRKNEYGYITIHNRIKSALDLGGTSVEDLVPNSYEYYTQYYGPKPDNSTIDEYLKITLPSFREKQIEADLTNGIEICILGASHHDLMPSDWLVHIDNDTLFDALESVDARHNPFGVLALLDLALNRIQDDRFHELAMELIDLLVAKELKREDGVDVYELLPALAQLTFNHISDLPNGMVFPSYWRRMCSWMHACLLAKLTSDYSIDIESFQGWVESLTTEECYYRQFLDMRYEPMIDAHHMTKALLKAEVIGRLDLIRSKHKEELKSLSSVQDKIDAAVASLQSGDSSLAQYIPGPLEGHICPSNFEGRKIEDSDADIVLNDLSNELLDRKWEQLASLSQHFDFGDKLLNGINRLLKVFTLSEREDERKAQLVNLACICVILAAHRSTELANSVADIIVQSSRKLTSEQELYSTIRILQLASTAFEDDKEWSSWVSKRFCEFTYGLPSQKYAIMFLNWLNLLKNNIDSCDPAYSRAEAIAASIF